MTDAITRRVRYGITEQKRRYGRFGFARLMQQTRRDLQIANLRPEFEVVPCDPIYEVRCRRCGKVYQLNQSSKQMSHAVRHKVADRFADEAVEGTYWWVKVRRNWRKVEIVRVEPGRGWLLGEYPWFVGSRQWWIRKPERFGEKVED